MTLPNIKEIDTYTKNQNDQMDRIVTKIDNLIEYCFKFAFCDLPYSRKDVYSFIQQVSTLFSLPYDNDTHLSTWHSKSAIWPRKTLNDFENDIDCLWNQLPEDAKQI